MTKPCTNRKIKPRGQGWSKKEWVEAVMDKERKSKYYPEIGKEEDEQVQ